MNKFTPNYNEYRRILKDIKKTQKYCDYTEAIKKENFIILRHDIEFSISRAYGLSLVESEEGICSTYFVQITNNSYNAFSKKNIELLRKMIQNGHHIGLHYHCNGEKKQDKIIEGIKREIPILEMMIGDAYKVDRFSMHRPSIESEYWNININGIINAYGKDFFTFSKDLENKQTLKIKYIADSKHRWNYGYPNYETLTNNKKVQILIHPFSWTSEGYDNENNFMSLIDEKNYELMKTFSSEFQRYEECRDIIESKYERLCNK